MILMRKKMGHTAVLEEPEETIDWPVMLQRFKQYLFDNEYTYIDTYNVM